MKYYLKPKRGLLLVPIFCVLLLSGCSILESEKGNSIEDLKFQLMINKTELDSGNKLRATYTATNLTNSKLDIVTICFSFATISVYKEDKNMNFSGANMGCRTALGNYEISPKETLKFEWDVYAYRLSREVGQTTYDTTFVAPGDYTLRVNSNIGQINDEYVSVEPESMSFIVR